MPLDFLGLESSLNDSQREILNLSRSFVSREATPFIRAAYREEKFPEHLPAKMGALGFLGSTLAVDGRDPIDNVSYGLIMRELERCDSAIRSFASVQGTLVMYPIYRFGSDEQKGRWLGLLGSGSRIGCFGLTESHGGSDPGSMKTRAVRQNGRWILTGGKCWITNGSVADVGVIWANTDVGIRGFLVDMKTPGITATRMEGKLSLRASITSELFFDNVHLPESALLPGALGLKSALECLNLARFSILWGVLGAAEACFDEALEFSKHRILFGKPLASFQLTQQKFARMASQITQAQWLALRLAQLKDAGTLHFSQISLGKQANVEMALSVARGARDILGAHGIIDEHSVMRHMNNLESVYTYEGTNDIHQLIVGSALTGFPAF